ncbi:MAG: 2'-5' RNA ligase family protein [Pseudomonadota bacterium]
MWKSDQTTIALVPPPALRSRIEDIRWRHDRNVFWVPAHVTLLYPFVEAVEIGALLPDLRRLCAGIPAFTLELSRFSWFSQPDDVSTLWLAPDPPAPVIALHDALLGRVPTCDDQTRYPGGYTPHITVGEATGARQRDAMLRELAATWTPARWTVDRITVLLRSGKDPFRVTDELALGGAPPRRRGAARAPRW